MFFFLAFFFGRGGFLNFQFSVLFLFLRFIISLVRVVHEHNIILRFCSSSIFDLLLVARIESVRRCANLIGKRKAKGKKMPTVYVVILVAATREPTRASLLIMCKLKYPLLLIWLSLHRFHRSSAQKISPFFATHDGEEDNPKNKIKTKYSRFRLTMRIKAPPLWHLYFFYHYN